MRENLNYQSLSRKFKNSEVKEKLGLVDAYSFLVLPAAPPFPRSPQWSRDIARIQPLHKIPASQEEEATKKGTLLPKHTFWKLHNISV